MAETLRQNRVTRHHTMAEMLIFDRGIRCDYIVIGFLFRRLPVCCLPVSPSFATSHRCLVIRVSTLVLYDFVRCTAQIDKCPEIGRHAEIE